MAPGDHYGAVRRAWCEALNVDACEGSWEDAGGDSIATLHFMFRLELLLGYAPPLERLRLDMTADAMAEALAGPVQVGTDDTLPVFLMAGILGDGPSLVAFRQRLAGRVRFTLIHAGNADDAAAMLGDVAATARHAVARIVALQPEGPLRLAGYSFGGSIMLEAAVQLTEAGREVALVAVFDTAFGDAVLGAPVLKWRRRYRRRAARLVTRLLAWDRCRHLAQRLADRLSPDRAPRLRQFALRRFRTEARLAWQPRPLSVPVFLALSDEFAPIMGPAWTRHYPHAAVTRVPSTHFGLFRGDALELVAAAFERSLETGAARPGQA